MFSIRSYVENDVLIIDVDGEITEIPLWLIALEAYYDHDQDEDSPS